MFLSDGGYSRAQFDAAELRKVVASLSLAIPHYLKEANADGIVVTGKSGISMAFATLSHIDFPLVVVRKEGENSHGSKIEGRERINYRRLLALDDFVSSGATIQAMQRALDERFCYSDQPTVIVGVLEWAEKYSGAYGWLDLRTRTIDCVNVYGFDPADPPELRNAIS